MHKETQETKIENSCYVAKGKLLMQQLPLWDLVFWKMLILIFLKEILFFERKNHSPCLLLKGYGSKTPKNPSKAQKKQQLDHHLSIRPKPISETFEPFMSRLSFNNPNMNTRLAFNPFE